MARTGPLLTSGTSLWCPMRVSRSPSGLLAPSPSTLSRLSLVATPTSRLRLPTTQQHYWVAPTSNGKVFRVFSSTLLPGFSGPESSVLHADLSSSVPFPIRVSPLSGPFYGPSRKHSEPGQKDFPG